MRSIKERLIVALDVDSFEEARKLIEALDDSVDTFKVGSQLFTACGPVVVRYLIARGKKVFLDLKYHDIPNTVANAMTVAVGLGQARHEVMTEEGTPAAPEVPGRLFMCTVHIQGGEEMLTRAVGAARVQAEQLALPRPLIVGITVLTSAMKSPNIRRIVLERSDLARKAGLDGVVASSQESASIRQAMGKDFVIVTPGIRPAGADVGDQKRVTTPHEALRNGSDFLVVGRPIVQAASPQQAAKDILKQMQGGTTD